MKIKSEVSKRLTNHKERVKLKLQSGEELKGRLKRASDNSFVLANEKSGAETEIEYAQVKSVYGRGLGTGTKVAIIAGAVVLTVAIIAAYSITHFDPFENGILR
jgi:small nuclear ribonucleoprotein (snRNP)-like protein